MMMLVRELSQMYMEWGRTYYRKPVSGRTTMSTHRIRLAIDAMASTPLPDAPERSLLDLPVESMTAKLLYVMQQRLANRGLCRSTVNLWVSEVQRMYRWASRPENDLVSEDVAVRVGLLGALRFGRSPAREPERIESVPLAMVQATCLYAPEKIRVLCAVHWHTGARPAEVCAMRVSQLDRSGDIWLLDVPDHKAAHLGRKRIIPLGPQSQKALAPWLAKLDGDVVFRGKRGQPMQPEGYRSAIVRINRRHGLAEWLPRQIRHSYATRIGREADEKTAQLMLDHADMKTTSIYLDPNTPKKLEVARRFG